MHDAAGIPFHLLRPLWLLALIPVAAIFATCCSGGKTRGRNGAG